MTDDEIHKTILSDFVTWLETNGIQLIPSDSAGYPIVENVCDYRQIVYDYIHDGELPESG